MTTQAAPALTGPRPTTGVPSRVADRHLAGVVTFIEAAQFMTVIMLAASMAPGYDVGGGAISDLGVIAETALLFNASLVLVGVLKVVSGVLLARIGGGRGLLALYALAGIGAIGAGLIPLDRGGAHGLFALAAFVVFNLQAIAARRVSEGPMAAIGVVAGLVGLAFVGLMVVGDSGDPAVFGPIGHGGAERMIVYPVMLWLLAFGGYLLAREPHEPPNPD